ncbi:MAG: hypothetical protein U0798_21300 [Gemmataceae bacterium]
MIRRFLSLAVVVAAVCGVAVAAEIKSGPQPGEKIPGPFHPLNVTGESKGEKACLVCKAGNSPVAMVFARCADCDMTATLIKKLDEVTAKNQAKDMNSFAVFLTDDTEVFTKKLEAMGKKNSLKFCTLAIDNPTGPEKYNVSKDADVTVVLYVKRDIKANYAFKKGELTAEKIDAIVNDVAKIVK